MSTDPDATPFNWRDHLAIHPAADLFPLMSEAELKELADDIKRNGLQQSVVFRWTDKDGIQLIDGRNRLDALALLGLLAPGERRHAMVPPVTIELRGRGLRLVPVTLKTDDDVVRYVITANIRRRHLSADDKRKVIADLLKLQPATSNRQIAKTVAADHKTVGDVRSELEGRGEIPHVETRTNSKGRKQPAKRKSFPAKVQINGQAISTADFSPAAQQILNGLAAEMADAIGRKSEYAKAMGQDANRDAEIEMTANAAAIATTNAFHNEIVSYVDDFANRLLEWLKNADAPKEAKSTLHDAMMLAANELMTLAQEIDGRGADSQIEAAA